MISEPPRASISRRLLIFAFFFDTSSRLYALVEDIGSPSFSGSYEPHLYALALAYLFQVIVEVIWIINGLGQQADANRVAIHDERVVDAEEGVFINNEKPQARQRNTGIHKTSDEAELQEFIPLYVVGCLCQGTWAMSWLSKNYALCRLFLTISAVTQLYAIFAILNGSRNRGLPHRNIAIHLITKSRAAMAMLLLWKTWGTDEKLPSPSPTQQINNLSFLLIFAMSSGPDPTMGLFLAYGLFSLAIGPYSSPRSTTPQSGLSNLRTTGSTVGVAARERGGWHGTFGWTGTVVLIVILLDWTVARRSRWGIRMRSRTSLNNSLSFLSTSPPDYTATDVLSGQPQSEEQQWNEEDYYDEEQESDGEVDEEAEKSPAAVKGQLPPDYLTGNVADKGRQATFMLVVDPPEARHQLRPSNPV